MQKGVVNCIKKHQDNRTDTENDEEGDSSVDEDDDNRLSFVRSIHVDPSALENRMSESELRIQDAASARNECDRVVANWIEHKIIWNKLYDKRELNLLPNETRKYFHENYWK